jgi:hypothetical protein
VLASKAGENTLCQGNTNLWECLGTDRDWGLVSVLHTPGERRLDSIPRLVARAELVLVNNYRAASIPTYHRYAPPHSIPCLHAYCARLCQDRRRCYSHPHHHQLLLQGGLDTTGEIFARAVAAVEEDSAGGSRLDLIRIASLLTTGDILELGTDQDTTELLHTAVQAENARKEEAELVRMLVTADSTSTWLSQHSGLLCSFHLFVFVPLYWVGVGCKTSHQPQITCKHLQS